MAWPVALEVIEKKSLKNWRAQGDDFRTFLRDFVSVVPQSTPCELSL